MTNIVPLRLSGVTAHKHILHLLKVAAEEVAGSRYAMNGIHFTPDGSYLATCGSALVKVTQVAPISGVVFPMQAGTLESGALKKAFAKQPTPMQVRGGKKSVKPKNLSSLFVVKGRYPPFDGVLARTDSKDEDNYAEASIIDVAAFQRVLALAGKATPFARFHAGSSSTVIAHKDTDYSLTIDTPLMFLSDQWRRDLDVVVFNPIKFRDLLTAMRAASLTGAAYKSMTVRWPRRAALPLVICVQTATHDATGLLMPIKV